MFAAKLVLLTFWSVWFLITFASNLCGGLKEMKLLDARWKFASENYRGVVDATSVYDAPRWLTAVLFAGVILWQLAAAVLFARAAVLSCLDANIAVGAATAAFTAGAGLPAAFMLADEIFLQYERQASHATLFIAQLATWLAVILLPD
jgi:hypothetical protein